MKHRRLFSGVAFGISAGAILLFAGSCGNQSRSGDPPAVKIVSSFPMQGSVQAQTQTMVNSIRLALEEAKSQAGGCQIVYEPWDDASAQKGSWDGAVEAANARRAVSDKAVVAYIGTFNSGAAKVAMPILNEAETVMISPANTYVGLTKPGKGEPSEPAIYRPTGQINFFRVVPADDVQGSAGARWAKKLGVKSVYILDDRELYGKGIADVFETECGKLGIKVLGHEGIDPKAMEYKALLTKARALNPDLIYFGGTTQSNGAQIVRDMRNVGLEAKFMGPDGCFEEAFIKAGGPENLEGRCYFTFGGVPPAKLTGRGAEFYRRYKERFGSEPESYAVYAYDCAQIVLEAIRRAAKKGPVDRAKVLAEVRNLGEYDGALGKYSFDENGDTTLTVMSGQIVRDGKFEFMEMLAGQ